MPLALRPSSGTRTESPASIFDQGYLGHSTGAGTPLSTLSSFMAGFLASRIRGLRIHF